MWNETLKYLWAKRKKEAIEIFSMKAEEERRENLEMKEMTEMKT